VRFVAAALAATTGVLHAYLAWEFFDAGLLEDAVIFAGMAGPYVLAAGLLVAARWLRWTVRLGMAYVALLLVVWLFEGARTEIGYVTKVVELGLLAVLVLMEWRSRPG
jgi:hypothetical protein